MSKPEAHTDASMNSNHDECMAALSAAGMYLALDVNNGLYSINRADPEPSYNAVRTTQDYQVKDRILMTIRSICKVFLPRSMRSQATTTPYCSSPETKSSMTHRTQTVHHISRLWTEI